MPTNSAPTPLRVLIVDDSRGQRALMRSHLFALGFECVEATTAAQALQIYNSQPPATPIDIIVSDWMMPQMSGLELCHKIRASTPVQNPYVYFILLTVKSETFDIAKGLGAGADDFLIKPVAKVELNARLRNGARILEMQRALAEKQRQTASAMLIIQTDLKEAGELHRAMMPPSIADYDGAKICTLFQSSQHLGGDVLGHFWIDADRVGFYCLDVCGHGVPSALLGVRLGAYFNPDNKARNIVFYQDAGVYKKRAPHEVAAALNALMLQTHETDLYFTLAYGEVNLKSGAGLIVQAGAPHPLILGKDGAVTQLGAGGPPIGLMPKAQWQSIPFRLEKNARLILYSDGLVECENTNGVALEEEGLITRIIAQRKTEVKDFLPNLMKEVKEFRGSADFEDDISALVIEL